MVCTRPIEGYRAPRGQIAFTKKAGYSDLKVTVPCGQCQGCRLERSRQWAMRIMHEASLYQDNMFLTLTYRDAQLPENESLYLRDHQLFLKRLRKHVWKTQKTKLRFYHVGEYGETTFRPHYHDIIFNLTMPDMVYLKKTKTDQKLYTSETLDKIWSHGDVYIGEVTFESAAYCGRYVMKKLTGTRKSEYGDLAPEYSTMSRNPGIGSPWLAKWKTDVYPLDSCIFKGRKVRVPKAYDNLLVKADDGNSDTGCWKLDSTGYPIYMPGFDRSEIGGYRTKRKRNALKHSENQTRERLDVIEELTARRVELLTRS